MAYWIRPNMDKQTIIRELEGFVRGVKNGSIVINNMDITYTVELPGIPKQGELLPFEVRADAESVVITIRCFKPKEFPKIRKSAKR